MKVVVTFDVDEKNLDDLVAMVKVYRKKNGYKKFVSVENNLPLKPLPQKLREGAYGGIYRYDEGWNQCLDEIVGEAE